MLYFISSSLLGLLSITNALGLSITSSNVIPPKSSYNSCIASYIDSASLRSEKLIAFFCWLIISWKNSILF